MKIKKYSKDVTSKEIVRINDLDLSRATTQAALDTSLLLGRGIQPGSRKNQIKGVDGLDVRRSALRVGPAERRAYCSLLGVLKHEAFCRGRLIDLMTEDKGVAKSAMKHANQLGHQVARSDKDGKWDLDFVASACDGVEDFLRGYYGGAASILAGGPKGVFGDPNKTDSVYEPEYYLVIAIRSDGPSTSKLFDKDDLDLGNSPNRLITIFSKFRLLENILLHTGRTKHPERLTIGTMGQTGQGRKAVQKKKLLLGPILSSVGRVQIFFGSPIAAALCAFLPNGGIDAFTSIVPSPQATLIAAAARATHNEFYAIPVSVGESVTVNVNDSNSVKVCRDSDFIYNDDVFLILTGISAHPQLFNGVCFLGDDEVETQTLCLRSHTRSMRIITQRHDLSKKIFHFVKSTKPQPYETVIKHHNKNHYVL